MDTIINSHARTHTHKQLIGNKIEVKIAKHSICEIQLGREKTAVKKRNHKQQHKRSKKQPKEATP